VYTVRKEIVLSPVRYASFLQRGRTSAFNDASLKKDETVLAVCGDQEQLAFIARAGRNTWVAKPLEFLNAKAAE